MSVQSRFADDDSRPVTGACAELLDSFAQRLHAFVFQQEPLALDAGGWTVLAKDLAQGAGPFARGYPRQGAFYRRLHHVGPRSSGFFQRRQGAFDASGVTFGFDLRQGFKGFSGCGRVDLEHAAIVAAEQRRRKPFGPSIQSNDDLVAGVDAADPFGHRAHQSRFHITRFHCRANAAHLQDAFNFYTRLGFEGVDLGFDDYAAIKDVRVLEQVGFVGEDLLQTQRPLLVPRPGQGERFIPRR